MTWPEEVGLLAGDYWTAIPGFLLLANSTTFYIYDFDMDGLFRAGNTLAEVYQGLFQRRWSFSPDDRTAELWFLEPDCGSEYYDRYDYFPIWRGGNDENGKDTLVLANPLLPFTPPDIDLMRILDTNLRSMRKKNC